MSEKSEDDKEKKFGEKEKKILEEDFKKKIKDYTKEDLEKLIESEEELKEKYKKVPEKLKKIIKQVKLLYELLKDYWNGQYKDIPWTSITAIIFCIIYFLSPIDLIPDAIPVIGFVDDAYAIKLTIKFISEDLKDYCKFKGYDPDDYFKAEK